jgi:hypothetical protein
MLFVKKILRLIPSIVLVCSLLPAKAQINSPFSRYGLGKVAALGDSSPADDGTGDPNDVLYDGYIAGANGNHKKLIMNTTFWLVNNFTTGIEQYSKSTFNVFPNPFKDELTVTLSENKNSVFEILALSGKSIRTFEVFGDNSTTIDLSTLAPGLYLLQNKSNKSDCQKIIKY